MAAAPIVPRSDAGLSGCSCRCMTLVKGTHEGDLEVRSTGKCTGASLTMLQTTVMREDQ